MINQMLASLETWALKDAVISTRGAKSCPLENTKCPGSSVTLNIGTADSPVSSPFGATSFGDENTQRKTLELSMEPCHTPQWDAINSWAKTYIVENSERLFKKRLSKDVVQENYKPVYTQKGEYRPLLRTKINLEGSRKARCWDASGKQVDMPDLRNVPISVRLAVDRLWIMSSNYGLCLEVTDVMLHGTAPSPSCPF